MHPLLILLLGMATILGGILGLRLNAFLALITAAIVVSLLAPGEPAAKIARVAPPPSRPPGGRGHAGRGLGNLGPGRPGRRAACGGNGVVVRGMGGPPHARRAAGRRRGAERDRATSRSRRLTPAHRLARPADFV